MNAAQDNPLAALERTLSALVEVHAQLADALDRQYAAMRKFDATEMSALVRRQESLHRRVLKLERERRDQAAAAFRLARLPRGATLEDLAAANPDAGPKLLALRAELRGRSESVAARGRRCGRVAGTVLTSLAAALRDLTGSSLYARDGGFSPPPQTRRVEAIG